jgi:alpha-methylacyl-CoA racemase
MLMADLGADVVVVDRAGPGVGAMLGKPTQNLLNRGKRSILVDLKTPEGVATVLALAARSDVLIEAYRPGVAERLGIGPESCTELNPRLVYGRMTGWGQDGPLAPTAGHDIGYLALTGVLHALGRADGPPQIPLNLLGDFAGGSMYLVVGILAALRHAERTGCGQVVDAAIVDGAAHLATMIYNMLDVGVWQDRRGVNLLDSGAPFYDVYETSDGRHMAVGPIEPAFYQEMLTVLCLDPARLPEQFDARRWPQLREQLQFAFSARTQAYWVAAFRSSDACVAPVLTMGEAPVHPHNVARSTFVEHLGVIQPAPAPRFSTTPTILRGAPPAPGEHGDRVLADWGVHTPRANSAPNKASDHAAVGTRTDTARGL